MIYSKVGDVLSLCVLYPHRISSASMTIYTSTTHRNRVRSVKFRNLSRPILKLCGITRGLKQSSTKGDLEIRSSWDTESEIASASWKFHSNFSFVKGMNLRTSSQRAVFLLLKLYVRELRAFFQNRIIGKKSDDCSHQKQKILREKYFV